MIVLTKLNDVPFVLNCDIIETVFENPDTTIRLTNGSVYIVKESIESIIEKIVAFRKRAFEGIIKAENWNS